MAEVMEYKCPNCGGAIAFDSNLQKMKCPYCDSELEMDSLKKLDEQLKELPASKDLTWEDQEVSKWQEDEQVKVYVCQSCGGQLVTDAETAATACPYCDNPVVLKERVTGDFKPDYVIPFKLDKKAATAALSKHLLGKRLLPKVFKDENHIDEVKGLYVPFWLFDADAEADVRYSGARVKSWSDSRYIYTETSHFSLLRSGKMLFDNVPVDGSSKLDDQLMQSLEPFHFKEAVSFQTAYLAGYLADKYDQNAQVSLDFANQRVRQSTEKAMARTVRKFTSITTDDTSIRLHNDEAKYVLYPIWLLNTTWNGQKYTFAMNGQTGKFVGDLPLDKGAYWRNFLGLTIGGALVTYLLIWLVYLML